MSVLQFRRSHRLELRKQCLPFLFRNASIASEPVKKSVKGEDKFLQVIVIEDRRVGR
jgi:hypothetical protein